MPLTARSSDRRRRKNPDEKVPERSGESSAQVMAPTRMKLRVRRRDNMAAAAAGEEERTRESGGHSSSRRKNASKTTTAAAAGASPPTSSTSASARAVMAAEEASPDSKCPICLDRFNNLAYLDRCLHRFCFPCIQEWSHNKAECPLCKQPFASILHSVRAEDDFKEYTLRPAPANSSVAATVAMVAAMASAARSDHQMRLMLRRHRVADGGETTTRRRRRERGARGGSRRGEERAGVWEWYLDSPPLPLPSLPPLPQRPVATEDSEDGEELEEQRLRGGSDLAERGVIFEGLTGLGGAVAPVVPNDRASRRLMTRLAARQRLQREGGTVRRLRERETVAFRRALYRCGIRVRGVAGNQGQQQQRDITAESFRRNPAHLNRLRPWLRRELTVLYGAHGSLVDIVQRIIMAQLARHGLEDTPTIEEELRPFLLARTEHFLHELVSFARSPLSLDNYDLQASYEPPAAAMELDGMNTSSDSSSVIAISEGEEEERGEEGRGSGVHDEVIQTGSCLSLSGWDDETPGPSYSTAEPSCSLSFSPVPQEPTNEEGVEKQAEEEGEEECLIVGYKKPIAERTPELVQLSSDTEDDEGKKKEETPEKPPPLPSTTPPPYLPTIPPSTSGVYRDEQDNGEKDGEARVRRSRSWSGSSRNSVCTLSPATPGEGERRRERASWRDRKQPSGEAAREKRRKKRRRRGRERKSGTLYNPNRSIYPAMMRRRSHSPSPFRSSAESGSPPDSNWEYRCSQVSPLASSVSSPSCSSSSSAFCSSPPPSSPPPQTPPSLSPGSSSHHGEKPGGKRKYKSRHLDSDVKDPTWRPSSSHHKERRREKERRRRRDRKRSSSRRPREDRSPSVEIIYEGTITSDAVKPRGHKRRRRRHRGPHYCSSPVIITLDSDSGHEDANNNKNRIISSSSSSPLSSQQTVDFSDLPPLPLVPSAGVGGALDAEIGELPIDILDRGSDGSDSKGLIAIDNSDNSDRDVDVENMEEGGAPAANTRDDQPIGEHVDAHKRKAPPSDHHLLATILDDLKGISAPTPNRPLNSEAGFSPDTQRKRCREPCKVRQNQQQDQTPGASDPSPPPLKRPNEFQVREESQNVPPLLRQASPVRSYNRNTPPPLKHKDAGSPGRSPASPASLHLHHTSDPIVPPVLLGSNPIKSRLAAELPTDKQTIPPISVLKGHLTSAWRGEPNASSIHSRPSSFKTSPFTHPEFGSFHPAAIHSVAVETPSPVDLHPVNSSTDFHPANSCSKEKPVLSTSRNKTVKSAVGLHPPPAGSGVFSGVNSNDTSPPAFVSSVSSRTPSSSADSLGPGKWENPSERTSASIDLHVGSPNSTVDLCGSGAPLEAPKPSSGSCSQPASLNFSYFDGHLNHAALPSADFHTSQSTAKPQNHFDSQLPVKLSQIHADNHLTSTENQHNAAIDACSDCPSPERSDGAT